MDDDLTSVLLAAANSSETVNPETVVSRFGIVCNT